MKRKKLKALFQAVERISRYKREDVITGPSDFHYQYGDGQKSPPIRLLATKGKHVLPETQEIMKIICSIEPVNLQHDMKIINEAAGFPLMVIMVNENDNHQMIVLVNTVYGAICFLVAINENEKLPDPITEEEFSLLKKVMIQ